MVLLEALFETHRGVEAPDVVVVSQDRFLHAADHVCGATVGANSQVVRAVEPLVTVVGVPARVLAGPTAGKPPGEIVSERARNG